MVRWGCCSFFWVSCFGQEKEKQHTSCDIMGVSAVHHRLCHFHFPQSVKTAKKHTMTQCCWERLHRSRWNMFIIFQSASYVLPRPSTIHVFQTRLDSIKSTWPCIGHQDSQNQSALGWTLWRPHSHSCLNQRVCRHTSYLVGSPPMLHFCYHHPSGLSEATIFHTCTFDISMPQSCFE